MITQISYTYNISFFCIVIQLLFKMCTGFRKVMVVVTKQITTMLVNGGLSFFKPDGVTCLMETVEMSQCSDQSRYSAGGENTWGIPGVYGTWNSVMGQFD